MSLRSSDLKSQRESIMEDVDGSGGESESAAIDVEGGSKKAAKLAKSTGEVKVCAMIAVLLCGFGALALTAIAVVTAAFDPNRAAAAAADAANVVKSLTNLSAFD
jgi:hypothetical protein